MLYSKETNYDPTFGGLRKGVWIGLSGTNALTTGNSRHDLTSRTQSDGYGWQRTYQVEMAG